MSDVNDLYRNAIVDHYKMPRNFREIDGANRRADGHNPLCGDKFTVYLLLEDTFIRDIGFTGSGCAIATSSASMMTDNLKGRTETEARALFRRFTELVTGGAGYNEAEFPENLSIFKDVRGYPARVKCALLAWHTLLAALDEIKQTVETE